jgi:hypothetical protein
MRTRARTSALVAALSVFTLFGRAAAQEPALSTEEMRQFLLTADIVASHGTGNGVTLPLRLTLSNGTLTHDAAFQAIDDHAPLRQFENGRVEANFVDSYKYDIAAYAIAELVGLDDMMPVTVERRWKNRTGALSWWLPTKMDERTRIARKVEPPDQNAWNEQMHRVRVFSALVDDTDRNLTNILISDDWKIWMIDFTRAFRRYPTPPDEKSLVRCDRRLLSRLQSLDRGAVEHATSGRLEKPEIDALMRRRDWLVDHFLKLVAENGERAVLY